jgi:hypothetical protein
MTHTKDEALPFGVGGGLVAIKTLLSRDPCVHANTAIEMIDTILKEHRAAQPSPVQEPVDSMGMPLSCGKPLCAPGDHHPLCKLSTQPPAQPAPNCTRSHPHENMDAMCELRTEIARLTNENARLKAAR